MSTVMAHPCWWQSLPILRNDCEAQPLQLCHIVAVTSLLIVTTYYYVLQIIMELVDSSFCINGYQLQLLPGHKSLRVYRHRILAFDASSVPYCWRSGSSEQRTWSIVTRGLLCIASHGDVAWRDGSLPTPTDEDDRRNQTKNKSKMSLISTSGVCEKKIVLIEVAWRRLQSRKSYSAGTSLSGISK